LPDGEYPVILEPYDICGHIFKDFIAEYYVSGGSLFSGKAGTKVFNEKLSLSVDRNPKTNRVAPFYDEEGEIAKNYRATLIEKGVLTGVLNTKNTANTFGLKPSKTSGGAYDGVPGLEVAGLYAESTAPDLKTLLGDKKAIWIAISSGGDITTEGVIGMPVMLAFLVENGEIKGRVADFNASGNIFEMLGEGFIGVSKQNIMSASDAEMIVVNMKVING
jgi:predicted Zn-dependent protease